MFKLISILFLSICLFFIYKNKQTSYIYFNVVNNTSDTIFKAISIRVNNYYFRDTNFVIYKSRKLVIEKSKISLNNHDLSVECSLQSNISLNKNGLFYSDLSGNIKTNYDIYINEDSLLIIK